MNTHKNRKKYSGKDILKRIDDFERRAIVITLGMAFIEIEGEENKIIEIASKLNLNLKKNLTDACDTLFQQWRKERGLPFKPHMKFEDYDK